MDATRDGRPVSRRTALAGLAAVGGLAALAGCSGSGAGPTGSTSAPAAAAGTPLPAPATSTSVVPVVEVLDRSADGRVDTWRLRTPALPAEVAVRIVRPASYAGSPGRRYPVLYLLHGSADDGSAWLEKGALLDALGDAEVIVVLPDGGTQGWYVDWAQPSPPVRWESLHMGWLVGAVDERYRTIAARAGRAVAGNSMGGFGAVHYAQAFPDRFAAVTSFSGAVSLRRPIDFVALDAQAVDGKAAHAIFGSDADARARAVDPPGFAERLRGMRVRLYAGDGRSADGTQSQEELGLQEASRVLLTALQGAGVDAGLEILPGGHEFGQWTAALRRDLPGLLAALDRPRG